MSDNSAIERARRLRKTANLPERHAWAALRQLRKRNFTARRQYPIGPYVVDFAIRKAKLVIEIDGGIHRLEEVAKRDAKREEYLLSEGRRVLRLSSGEAFHEDYVLRTVMAALGI